MKLLILLFAAFLVQEPISSNAVLLEAYQNHYNVWLIHALFLLATTIDIFVGYHIGQFTHDRLSTNRVVTYLRNKFESFFTFTGKRSRRVALLVYGPIIFPFKVFFHKTNV